MKCPNCSCELKISVEKADVQMTTETPKPIVENTKVDKAYVQDYMLDFIPDLPAERIQKYLIKINSWLKDRACTYVVDKKTVVKTFSQFIYDLCFEHKISQVYILALIQKEQSALFRSTPPSEATQIKIVGYAVTESGKIPGYDGFETQFINAIKQLRRYDKWDQVINKTSVNLCDDAEDRAELRSKGIEFTGKYKPLSMGAAKSLLYTPRLAPLVQMGELYDKIVLAI